MIEIPRAPSDLTQLPQWVLWRHVRGTKVPNQADGRPASSTDSSTWTTYRDAIAAWLRRPKYFAGVGFVFTERDPFIGIDLDDCLLLDGSPKPWARGILARLADTYWEISPSGTGVKGWALGTLPDNVGNTPISIDGQTVGAIELYSSKRFFTVTGRLFSHCPLRLTDHTSDLLELHAWARRFRPRAAACTDAAGKIPYGSQHLSLVSMAGSMRRRGMCTEAIEAALQVVNRLQCEKPGAPENISRLARSTARWQVRS